MRSQLLVLLQNQVFTDSQGRLLSGEVPSQRLEMQLDCQMRSFYRTRYMHRQAPVFASDVTVMLCLYMLYAQARCCLCVTCDGGVVPYALNAQASCHFCMRGQASPMQSRYSCQDAGHSSTHIILP